MMRTKTLNWKLVLGIFLSAMILIGCPNARINRWETHGTSDRKLTLGLVQQNIRKGTPEANVYSVLGSPNYFSETDGIKTLVYDKISTETTWSKSKSGVGGGIAAGGKNSASTLLVGAGANGKIWERYRCYCHYAKNTHSCD